LACNGHDNTSRQSSTASFPTSLYRPPAMGCANSANSSSGEDKFQRRYQIGVKFGEGSYAQVRLAERREDKQMCVVKIIPIGKESLSSAEMVKREQAAWQAVGNHEHCVTLYETFHTKAQCYMVMEKCQSTVLDNLGIYLNMQDLKLADIFYQMLLALSHCHELNVVHRDVKPDNFLLARNGKTVKLCDFGLAAIQQKNTPLKGEFGAPPYMSPEMVSWKAYDEKTDVWSFGAIVYLMLFAQFPYTPPKSSVQNMKYAIRTGEPAIPFQRFEWFPHPPSTQAIEFVKSLLDRSAKTRCSAKEAMGHSFFQKHDEEDIALELNLHGESVGALSKKCNPHMPSQDSVPITNDFSCDGTFSQANISTRETTSCSSGSTASSGCETTCRPTLASL